MAIGYEESREGKEFQEIMKHYDLTCVAHPNVEVTVITQEQIAQLFQSASIAEEDNDTVNRIGVCHLKLTEQLEKCGDKYPFRLS